MKARRPHVLKVRLSDAERLELERLALLEGISVAELLRRRARERTAEIAPAAGIRRMA